MFRHSCFAVKPPTIIASALRHRENPFQIWNQKLSNPITEIRSGDLYCGLPKILLSQSICLFKATPDPARGGRDRPFLPSSPSLICALPLQDVCINPNCNSVLPQGRLCDRPLLRFLEIMLFFAHQRSSLILSQVWPKSTEYRCPDMYRPQRLSDQQNPYRQLRSAVHSCGFHI